MRALHTVIAVPLLGLREAVQRQPWIEFWRLRNS
jgi:hypothetical protein